MISMPANGCQLTEGLPMNSNASADMSDSILGRMTVITIHDRYSLLRVTITQMTFQTIIEPSNFHSRTNVHSHNKKFSSSS